MERESYFLSSHLLVHFRESLHIISKESLLSEKIFGRASAGFSKERISSIHTVE
jgi:hypothetical protein